MDMINGVDDEQRELKIFASYAFARLAQLAQRGDAVLLSSITRRENVALW